MPSTDPPSLRKNWLRSHPNFPWLDASRPDDLERYLRKHSIIAPDQQILGCAPAGDGNMNLTLRIQLEGESFVLKQSRPWVEKYDSIEAPWERDAVERRFYAHASGVPALDAFLPNLLHSDPSAHVLILEDLPGARDMTSLYDDGASLTTAEIDALARFLAVLHESSAASSDLAIANRSMRQLNFEHIFEIPLERGRDLDGFEPGLEAAAEKFRTDLDARSALKETGQRYLSEGATRLHGDYFPGSWLRTDRGVRVIDFEFSFPGDAEFDLGVATAHLVLGRQGTAALRRFLDGYGKARPGWAVDSTWLARYAGAEIMRRILGVAQLPIPIAESGPGKRSRFLEIAQSALTRSSLEPLFQPT